MVVKVQLSELREVISSVCRRCRRRYCRRWRGSRYFHLMQASFHAFLATRVALCVLLTENVCFTNSTILRHLFNHKYWTDIQRNKILGSISFNCEIIHPVKTSTSTKVYSPWKTCKSLICIETNSLLSGDPYTAMEGLWVEAG